MKECANQAAANLIASRSEYLAHGNFFAPLLNKISGHSNETEQRDQYGNEGEQLNDRSYTRFRLVFCCYLLVDIRIVKF